MSETEESRLDKWLWHARFIRTRTLASGFCEGGRIRVNGQPVAKAHHRVRPGDVLTFALGPHICVVRILAIALRRGPAPVARLLYEDLDPPAPAGEGARPPAQMPATNAERHPGSGRPTKTERRAIDRLQRSDR